MLRAAACRTLWHALGRLVPAGVAKWQTRQSQKLLGGDPRAGSTPASGTRWTKVGNAEWCNGNTGAFGASIPGSNPGSAARIIAESFLDSSTVEQAAVNRKVVGSNPTRGAWGAGLAIRPKSVRVHDRSRLTSSLPSGMLSLGAEKSACRIGNTDHGGEPALTMRGRQCCALPCRRGDYCCEVSAVTQR